MELARSSFYYQAKEPDAAMLKGDMDILDRIESICLDFHGYGYRRVTRQLQDDGYGINQKKVLRLMRESDLLCRAKRKWIRTTDSNHGLPVYRATWLRMCRSPASPRYGWQILLIYVSAMGLFTWQPYWMLFHGK